MKFKKKPVVVEAMLFRGSSTSKADIQRWMETGKYRVSTKHTQDTVDMVIPTLEGEMVVSPGDWVIKGVAGEFYPCKPDIFNRTYERVW